MKLAMMSNCKDPENHSKKKSCCCGGHSRKAKKPRNKKHRCAKPTTLMEDKDENRS